MINFARAILQRFAKSAEAQPTGEPVAEWIDEFEGHIKLQWRKGYIGKSGDKLYTADQCPQSDFCEGVTGQSLSMSIAPNIGELLAAKDRIIDDLDKKLISTQLIAVDVGFDLSKLKEELAELKKQVSFWASHTPTDSFIDEHEGLKVKVAELTAQLSEARKDAMEEAAKICDAVASDKADEYKGRGKHSPTNIQCGNPYTDGVSDGAGVCSDAIRAAMSEKGKP